jgi:hypothetical protein
MSLILENVRKDAGTGCPIRDASLLPFIDARYVNPPAPPHSFASGANASGCCHSFDLNQKIWTIET